MGVGMILSLLKLVPNSIKYSTLYILYSRYHTLTAILRPVFARHGTNKLIGFFQFITVVGLIKLCVLLSHKGVFMVKTQKALPGLMKNDAK